MLGACFGLLLGFVSCVTVKLQVNILPYSPTGQQHCTNQTMVCPLRQGDLYAATQQTAEKKFMFAELMPPTEPVEFRSARSYLTFVSYA